MIEPFFKQLLYMYLAQDGYIHPMPHYYLIYDDSCPICLAAMDKLRRVDTLGLVEPVPLSDPRLPHGKSLPPQHELKNAIHLFDNFGGMYRGADAVSKLMSLFPQSAWLGRVLQWPGVRQVARSVYALIARNRLRLSRVMIAKQ
jgi:predicted DCC family thiol-disulfide oxidoreductase YuxK